MERPQLTYYKRFIALRDGKECWFCGKQLPKDKLTIEHLLSVIDGGSHHVNNLVLACYHCNREAGALPVSAKVKLRERKRNV